MSDDKIKEMERKILEGLKLSYERLVAYKVKHDQSLVLSVGGKIVTIKARDLHKLNEVAKQQP